jgi:hypothetical protein
MHTSIAMVNTLELFVNVRWDINLEKKEHYWIPGSRYLQSSKLNKLARFIDQSDVRHVVKQLHKTVSSTSTSQPLEASYSITISSHLISATINYSYSS